MSIARRSLPELPPWLPDAREIALDLLSRNRFAALIVVSSPTKPLGDHQRQRKIILTRMTAEHPIRNVQPYTVNLWILSAVLPDVIALVAERLQMDEHAAIGTWLENKPPASVGLHVLLARRKSAGPENRVQAENVWSFAMVRS